MTFEPMEIKYRKDGKIQTILAEGVSGEIPAGSHTYFHIFRLVDGTLVRVSEQWMTKRYIERSKLLFGRPWLRRVYEGNEIRLCPYGNYDDELRGLPEDTQDVFKINFIHDAWVIQTSTGATLHIMNNPEVTKKGEFAVAVKKLFPDHKVTLVTYETIRHEKVL